MSLGLVGFSINIRQFLIDLKRIIIVTSKFLYSVNYNDATYLCDDKFVTKRYTIYPWTDCSCDSRLRQS